MHLSVWAIAESVGVTVHVHVRVCVHASLSIQHGKKKMEFVNTVYISNHIFIMTPLFSNCV